VFLISLELGFERYLVSSLINSWFLNVWTLFLNTIYFIFLRPVHRFVNLSLIQQSFHRLLLWTFVGFHRILVLHFIKVVWRFDGNFRVLLFIFLVFGQGRLDGNYLANVIVGVISLLYVTRGRSQLVWNMFLTLSMAFARKLIGIIFEIKGRYGLLLRFDEFVHFL
jgi:hypothetical protein